MLWEICELKALSVKTSSILGEYLWMLERKGLCGRVREDKDIMELRGKDLRESNRIYEYLSFSGSLSAYFQKLFQESCREYLYSLDHQKYSMIYSRL